MSGTIVERLRGKRRVHLDSVTVIYFIEQHAIYGPLIRPLFECVDRGEMLVVTSYLTLLEVLVQPIRAGRLDVAQEYRDVLVQSRHVTLHAVDRAIAEQGAEIRATYPAIKTPDAIQLATALRQSAEIFVTNDRRLHGFDRLEVLVLDDLLPGGAL
jgi:predicted nucleic acid-binding protein